MEQSLGSNFRVDECRSTLNYDYPDRLTIKNELALVYEENGQITEPLARLDYVVAEQEQSS